MSLGGGSAAAELPRSALRTCARARAAVGSPAAPAALKSGALHLLRSGGPGYVSLK